MSIPYLRMKKVLSYSDARKVLKRVPKEDCFWFCNNAEKRSLVDIAEELNRVDDTVFRYHVNRGKNDFESWVREKLNDKELAREISRIKTKDTLFRKIQERVDELNTILDANKRAIAKISASKTIRKTVSSRVHKYKKPSVSGSKTVRKSTKVKPKRRLVPVTKKKPSPIKKYVKRKK